MFTLVEIIFIIYLHCAVYVPNYFNSTFLVIRIFIYMTICILPTASFDMNISVDGLFFIGSQLVTLSYTGKVAVWQSMTQHWQVITLVQLKMYGTSLKLHSELYTQCKNLFIKDKYYS